MGLFDYVKVSGPEFKCSEGHDLSGEEFQTKDLGCTMGNATIADGKLTTTPSDWGAPFIPGGMALIEIYCNCTRCPAFVQAKTFNLVDHGVTFKVLLEKDVVQRVERVGETSAEFVANTPKQPWMKDCRGPMLYQEAYKLHLEGVRNWMKGEK